jgi:hypothetical protein
MMKRDDVSHRDYFPALCACVSRHDDLQLPAGDQALSGEPLDQLRECRCRGTGELGAAFGDRVRDIGQRIAMRELGEQPFHRVGIGRRWHALLFLRPRS